MINANRLGLIEKNMVGLAALQLPLLLEVSSKMSFKDFLVLNKLNNLFYFYLSNIIHYLIIFSC